MTPTAAPTALLVCNKASECGFTDCPHATPHTEIDALCALKGPCYQWMQVRGIGAVTALCRCVAEIVEEEQE